MNQTGKISLLFMAVVLAFLLAALGIIYIVAAQAHQPSSAMLTFWSIPHSPSANSPARLEGKDLLAGLTPKEAIFKADRAVSALPAYEFEMIADIKTSVNKRMKGLYHGEFHVPDILIISHGARKIIRKGDQVRIKTLQGQWGLPEELGLANDDDYRFMLKMRPPHWALGIYFADMQEVIFGPEEKIGDHWCRTVQGTLLKPGAQNLEAKVGNNYSERVFYNFPINLTMFNLTPKKMIEMGDLTSKIEIWIGQKDLLVYRVNQLADFELEVVKPVKIKCKIKNYNQYRVLEKAVIAGIPESVKKELGIIK